MLHEIYEAETKKEAEKAFDRFIEVFEPKHPKAAECPAKDRTLMLAFYDFPAEIGDTYVRPIGLNRRLPPTLPRHFLPERN